MNMHNEQKFVGIRYFNQPCFCFVCLFLFRITLILTLADGTL